MTELENQPNLLIGRSCELSKLGTEIRLYIAGNNTLAQIEELLKEGFRVVRVFRENGEVVWESKS